jgi:histidine ammonia-lyase
LADNVSTIVAIELLAAAQGIDLREPATSPDLRLAVERIREVVKFYDRDRLMAPDIEAARGLVASGRLDTIGVLGAWRGFAAA